MKPNATLFEIFPFRYFKKTYFHLTHQYGIQHEWVQNEYPTLLSRQILRTLTQKQCMKNRSCRSFARGDDVSVNNRHIQQIVRAMMHIEHQSFIQ